MLIFTQPEFYTSMFQTTIGLRLLYSTVTCGNGVTRDFFSVLKLLVPTMKYYVVLPMFLLIINLCQWLTRR